MARRDRSDERARRALRRRRPRARTTTGSSRCSACASARDWTKSVHTVEPGFRALGAELEPVRSYTDANCMRCGSCLQGCPTNAGKSTMNTYIHDAWARGLLELRARRGSRARAVGSTAGAGDRRRVRRCRRRAARRGRGRRRRRRRGAEHAAAPAPFRASPGPRDRHATSASTLCGSSTASSTSRKTRTWSIRSPRTAWIIQRDEDGGFVVEATTIQDPIAFATTLCDEHGPALGRRASSRRCASSGTGSACSRWSTTRTTRSVVVDEAGGERFAVDFTAGRARAHRRRVRASAGRCSRRRAPRRSAGPGSSPRTSRAPAGWATTRRARRSTATASRTRCRRLFVGDASLVPRTLSVNPSLTIMALATRLADHLDADPNGYLRRRREPRCWRTPSSSWPSGAGARGLVAGVGERRSRRACATDADRAGAWAGGRSVARRSRAHASGGDGTVRLVRRCPRLPAYSCGLCVARADMHCEAPVHRANATAASHALSTSASAGSTVAHAAGDAAPHADAGSRPPRGRGLLPHLAVNDCAVIVSSESGTRSRQLLAAGAARSCNTLVERGPAGGAPAERLHREQARRRSALTKNACARVRRGRAIRGSTPSAAVRDHDAARCPRSRRERRSSSISRLAGRR